MRDESDIATKAQAVFDGLCDDPEVWATHGTPGFEKETKIVAAVAEALLSERKAEREKAAVVMKWQSATKAPRDGRTLLFCSDSELMFARWELNPWTNQMCFSSADFSIPTSRLDAWIFIDGIPDPRQFDDKDQQAAQG